LNYNKTGAVDFLNTRHKYLVLFDPKEISIYEFNDFNLIKRINIELFTGSGAKVLKDCHEQYIFCKHNQ
jgi:hypothetical protein